MPSLVTSPTFASDTANRLVRQSRFLIFIRILWILFSSFCSIPVASLMERESVRKFDGSTAITNSVSKPLCRK